ncbi:MAG: hypothetical protein KJ737_11445 [Proteobacteria bacterium]|nr:hypothetical protein [Pseudomonadota bacterium]
MDLTIFTGIAISTSSTIALNVGKGIQKMKVDVLTQGLNMFSKENRNDFLIWLFGVIVTASSIGLYSYAMKLTDKPSTVSSCTGLGLIALVVFAKYVLKEKVGPREIAGCTLIVLCTLSLTLNDSKIMTPQSFQIYELIKYSGIIISIFIVLVPYSLITHTLHGMVFGSLAGVMIGIGLFLGDIALVEANGDFVGQLYTPYPYIAFIAAVSALVFTQIGFLGGRAVVVVPCINACTILTPILLEYLIYGITLNTIQYFSILGILGGVILLSSTGMETRNPGIKKQ